MGCSDVSEFEHIYGQILTTPSCVYSRLFTWTRIVDDFNALIVWKTFIDICFSIKLSLWALTAAYTKFRRMIGSYEAVPTVTSPDVYTVTSSKRRDTSLGKAESIQLCNFRVGQATTGAEAQFWLRQPWCNLPLFFPPSSLRLLSLSHFNEGLGVSRWENCGIKGVCRYVLEHWRFNALNYFPFPFP